MQALYTAELYSDPTQSDPSSYTDYLIEESALSLWINQQPAAVFMRTPQHDLDLVCGFLWSEKIIEELDDLSYLNPCWRAPYRKIHAYLADGVWVRPTQRSNYISSSCGLCSLEDVKKPSQHQYPHIRPNLHTLDLIDRVAPTLDAIEQKRQRLRIQSDLYALSQKKIACYLADFNRQDSWFSQTGGCHAAALYAPHNMHARYFREDVGRHNAVDKVFGAAFRAQQYDLHNWVLLVSSRAGFEIIQKAVHVGVGAVITLGAASAMAHRYAKQHHLPLFSFTKKSKSHRHLAHL